MATSAKAELVSLEEYLSTVYEPDAEFVDGVIEERAMGEDDHSSWQAAITGYFVTRAVEWNLRVRPELRNQVGARRYRYPTSPSSMETHPKNRSPSIPRWQSLKS